MSKGECTADQKLKCPLRKHFSDNDHLVPQRYRFERNLPEEYKHLGSLIKRYIYTPENQQQTCRHEHNLKTESEAELLENCLPSEEFMRAAVGRLAIGGGPNVTETARPAIYSGHIQPDAA